MKSQSHYAEAARDKSIKEKIKKLPDSPGVYFFLGPPKRSEGSVKDKKILYIGKATSLRDRVRSYFSGNIGEVRGPLITKMLAEFTDIQFQKTDSVLEALILEANLVREHQPEANVDLKDDKSFNYVIITNEDFPRVLLVRQKELEKSFLGTSLENHGNFLLKISSVRRRRSSRGFSREDASTDFSIKQIFGPFPNGSQLKAAMKIVRKMFPFRGKRCNPGQGRPCFERQIGLCPGVCTGEISRADYAKQIKNITLFFEGNKKKLVSSLKKQMKDFAKSQEFEKAQEVKRQLYAIYHIQDVSLIKAEKIKSLSETTKAFRIESYDIAHLSGTNMVGVMTVVEDGEAKKSDYRKFVIRAKEGGDVGSLMEILSRRLRHSEWPLPDLLVVDGGVAQKRAAEKMLKANNLSIPVVAVVKDERHRPREILGMNHELRITNYGKEDLERQILLANSEAHRFAISFHRQKRGKDIRSR